MRTKPLIGAKVDAIEHLESELKKNEEELVAARAAAAAAKPSETFLLFFAAVASQARCMAQVLGAKWRTLPGAAYEKKKRHNHFFTLL